VSQMFTATIDTAGVFALFDRMAESAEFVCREVARDTAKRIVAEAQARERRAVSGTATGVTESGIHWELTRDGKGYIVLGYEAGLQDAPVDKYLEYGTMFMRAKPFFFQSAMLEETPHRERLVERLTDWLEEVGR